MIPEGNPLDLNTLPDDYYSRDESCREKKREGKKNGKVYKCRFCSHKFYKSQALGGHMNRHRQERETETLNHARQLVFRSYHNLPAQAASHLGYHPADNMGDLTMPMRFPSYFYGSASFSSSSSHVPLPPPHLALPSVSYSQRPVNDHSYYAGQVLCSTQQYGHHNLNCMAGGQEFVGVSDVERGGDDERNLTWDHEEKGETSLEFPFVQSFPFIFL